MEIKNIFQDIDLKDVRFTKMEEVEIKKVDKDSDEYEMTISTNSVDRYGEVVDQKGMEVENYLKNPVVLWGHNYFAPPIGTSLSIKSRAGKTKATFKFASTPFAQEIKTLVDERVIRTSSIGFIPKEFDQETQTHKKYELLEWSLVSVPANPEALMNSAKELGCNLVMKALKDIEKEKAEKKDIGRDWDNEKELESLETEVKTLKEELSKKDEKIVELKDQESTMERLANKIDEKITAAIDGLKPVDNSNNEPGDDKEAKLIQLAGKAINAVLAERNKQ